MKKVLATIGGGVVGLSALGSINSDEPSPPPVAPIVQQEIPAPKAPPEIPVVIEKEDEEKEEASEPIPEIVLEVENKIETPPEPLNVTPPTTEEGPDPEPVILPPKKTSPPPPPSEPKKVVVSQKNEPQCDPNYAGACVPIDSDVDCAGGKGNGPSYVKGPVQVIGKDIYRLDSDKDGWGCEN